MSSPLDRAASTDAPTHRAPRRAGGSSTSLSSLPSRLVAPPPPPTLKPSSPDVQLDLSSAASASTAHTHASLRTANDAPRPRSVLPSSSNPRPTTSVIESSQLWKTSAAKRAEKSWALQTECALYSDAKFKKYLALVERTLASFDSVSEWADFISFLARLHKAIQAYPAYNVVPRKLIVAKRLAQCLNPALPSGVHQRALDVYHHILSVVGPDGLRRDLHVWTSGLLPFFQYASTSVKPTLLAIYETFYLPLHDDLRPLTRALQMALLPGLEEETGEYFDRTIRLLDRISDAVEPAYFLQNLWLTLITTPSVRLAALNYLTRRMPDLTQHDDPTLLVGKDLGLMVRGLAHALDDDLLLVRRNTLDILVTHLAVDKPLFRRFVKRPDQILLVRSALHVVLRKDLSLNRRLYTWLLGADETPAAQIAFLDENALDLVRSALAQGFHGASALDTLERQKPYRIFVSLLDKWEIGQSLTRVLALDAFHAISLQVAKRQEEELVTTAKMLFEVIDPFLLYGRFLHAITQTMQSKQGSTEDGRSPLSLLCFIFKAFHIHDDETKHIHVPLLFAAVTQLLDQLLAHDQDKDGASTSQMLDALELLKLLITAMPSRVFVRIAEPGPANKGDSSASDAPDFWQRAHRLYTSSETDSQHAARHFVGFQDAASASALVELLSHVALQCGQRLFVRALDVFADLMRVLDGSEAADEIALVRADASSAPLRTHKLHWNADAWADSLMPFLQSVASFAQVERIVEVLISCCICRALDRPLVLDAPTRVDRIVAALLRYLSPAMAPYHVRAVELLWATNKVTRRSRLETALAHQLSHNDAAARAAALTAFGAYWRLSEDVSTDELRTPLLLVLDRLQASDADERQQAELWLRAHVRSYVKVVDPLVHMLVRNQPAQLAPATVNLDGISVVITHVEQPYNHELVVYALRTLAALVRFGGPGLVKALASTPLSASLSTATKQLVRAKTLDGAATYLDVVLDECVEWMRTYPAVQLEAQLAASSDTLRAAAVDAMHGLLQRTAIAPSRTDELERELIEALLVAVHRGATATVEALLRCWQRARHDTRGAEAVVEVLAIVTPSAQILVTFLCDVLGTRMVRGDADRSRRTASSNSAGAVNDATLLLFFEQVLERMDPAEATQVWPVVIVLVKEFVASALARKVHVYPMLRILTALGEKLCLTAGMEERRTRRELQDNYAKLVDACILLSGRSLDASTWMRRSGREEDVGVEREADELARALAPEVSGVTEAINVFLATRALAALRKMQLDTDRVQTLVANAVYYIAAPAARTRSEKLQVEPHVVALLSELVRMPGTVKAWRSTVGDLFGDARFFSMGVSSATRWKPIVVALLTQDKERLADVLARVSTASTAANIFANRELEMVSRALSLRRLSFALFAGERDAFVVQLAQIQEKVVELLRTAPSEVLQAEVYLCLRVVLVRFSARHLTSFWPVLMTELMRLYDGVASEPERFEQSADARQLVLSTLKLLDMLVLLQPDDFQINEWMFITDTIDAVYPSDDFHADTLLDALAATFSRDTAASSGKAATGSQHHQGGAGAGAAANGQRRLQLGEMRTISSLGEVVPFLHSVSQNAFEAHYSDAGVDVEHVEACLLRDMFDGDDECRSGADL
ncbi:hypothetical protein PaG_01061 [Moesziomyces aphidis]|uniref:Uncharacterized protein n=1 Tax=Moesziomyces aphidis TaxID=84754 RepID=W3VUT9_MOEAP|nr:hypothetical protein PaG_01061 [Moesziomyces aphidis]